MPDLVTTAKGIAGGLPLAGVVGRAELMDAVHVGGLGGTYGGNPVACAAALAAIETMRELDLGAAARRIEAVLRPGCPPSPPTRASATSAGAARCWRSSWSSRAPRADGPTPDPARTAAVARPATRPGCWC